MNPSTAPLSDLVGIEINGVRLDADSGPELAGVLVPWLYEHAVVCIRDLQLSPDALARFGECLGTLIHHNEENLRLDGLPGVMSLSNADDRDERQLNGGAHWHTDLVHSEEPASFTMLNAVAVPAAGGGTMFANQVAAYETLSPDRRELAESITVVHCYEGRRDGSMPTFEYPLVRRHPVTGRKALYAAADTGIGIAGMSDEEARPLLDEFAEYATQPRFVYLHRYRPHDLVIWDNAQLLHSAEVLQRAEGEATQRIMHRVSVRGWPQPAQNTRSAHG
ncbi:TauD/TfdA dioxygenase family protein [Elongatibacter sediminis]|uniref:TauD/TfdA family dioxygenase n=1 Tax=Elongatibacter sediminis TaxID=3119006 RepID=A0AAW9RGJ8_9GAMM